MSDLDELRNDIAFEMQTRAERFSRIGETDPDNPDEAELLEADGEETGNAVVDLVSRLTGAVSQQVVTSGRIFEEVGTSLGFDLRTLHGVVERLIEQEKEIEDLRHGLEDLRRRL